MSGSIAGTFGGGGGTGFPKMRSLTQTPRTTGDVVVPLAVTFNTAACVNTLLQQASKHALHNILGYTEEALVSIDFNHDPRSSIVDGSLTRVSHTHLLKCLLWCDNEWGFANRMLDTAALMGRSLRAS